MSFTNRDLVAIWLLAFLASAAVGTHGIVYWDAGDYVRLAIEGGPSGLLLGRPLFLFVSRVIVHAGVDPVWAEPVLRWFWTAAGATAAPAMAVLAVRLGLDRRAAWLAGVMVAVSPSFAHTAHQVLTDTPALALSIAALAAAANGHAVRAGVILGAAILTRETAALHLVAVVLLLGGRRGPIALAAAAVLVAGSLWVFPPPGVSQWFSTIAPSTAAHLITPAGVGLSVAWIFAAGPVPVVAGIVALARHRDRRLSFVCVPAAMATAALLFYPYGSYSPRYMLASVPIAFFLPAAGWLSRRKLATVVGLAVPLALVPLATQPARVAAARGADVMNRVSSLPARALVVPGHYCPQARLGAVIHERRDFDMLCPGQDWPADPAAALDAARAAGRLVAIDLADADWWGERERTNRDAIRAWASRRAGRDVDGFFVVDK